MCGFSTFILVRVPIAVRKHHDHKQLGGGKDVIGYTSTPQFIPELCRISRQEAGGKNCWGEHGRVLLMLLCMSCSACFLRTHSTTYLPRVAPLTVSWLLPYQSSVKKMHHRLSHGPIWWRYFLSWVFLPKLFPFVDWIQVAWFKLT